eukprot:SAG25_NODE_10573_length_329_cov_0.673913_1_plen_32_part_01
MISPFKATGCTQTNVMAGADHTVGSRAADAIG